MDQLLIRLLVAALLLVAAPAHAAITLVQGDPVRTSATSGVSGALAYSSAVTAGNTLIVTTSGDSTVTVSSVGDSVNGASSWTKAKAISGTAASTEMWFFTNTAAGTPTVTVTWTGASGGFQITLYEIHTTTASATIALDVTNSATGTTGVSNPGNLTTTGADAILIAATENRSGESTAGASYTFLNSATGNFFAGAQYRIVTSTSTYSTAFGTDTGDIWAAVSAAFKEVSGATGGYILTEAGDCINAENADRLITEDVSAGIGPCAAVASVVPQRTLIGVGQ